MKEQITFGDVSQEYSEFVEKFKPKKTTDDCYTPANIYGVIRDWVCKEYGVDASQIIRPFKPGGDYLREDYEGRVVVDNPPFSILTEIVKNYIDGGVKFFLFAPALTCFGAGRFACTILTDSEITYQNGAVVRTSFITNLDENYAVRTCPELFKLIRDEEKNNKAIHVKSLPKYNYPSNVMTAAGAQKYAAYGIDLRVRKDEAFFIRALDSQRVAKKAVFGGGYLISDRAAKAQEEAAERVEEIKRNATREGRVPQEWGLSEEERRIIEELNRRAE